MQKNLEIKLQLLIDAIRETENYLDYAKQLQRLQEQPELYRRVNEFRTGNYRLQTSADTAEQLEAQEAYMAENAELLANPLVEDFLQAELSLCRMLQEVECRITEGVDFDLGESI